jgi:hypothetical protein
VEDDDLDTEVNAEAEEHDRSSDEDDEDIVIADDSEELDDDVLAEEGYGALWLQQQVRFAVYSTTMRGNT